MSGADDLMPAANEATIAQGKADGFEVITGDAATLLLDIDTPASRKQYERVMPTLQQYFAVKSIEEWPSKSNNAHIRITLSQPIDDPFARYALQAALGSDGVKEVLTVIRERNGCASSSILFKPAPKPQTEAAEVFA